MGLHEKRVTRIILALAIMGSLCIGGLWWDSTRYYTTLKVGGIVYSPSHSSLAVLHVFDPSVYGIADGWERYEHLLDAHDSPTLFPSFELLLKSSTNPYSMIVLPYYLILLTYLATLTLIWLLLMNRLARRKIIREINASRANQ